jgi:LPS-assembly protein
MLVLLNTRRGMILRRPNDKHHFLFSKHPCNTAFFDVDRHAAYSSRGGAAFLSGPVAVRNPRSRAHHTRAREGRAYFLFSKRSRAATHGRKPMLGYPTVFTDCMFSANRHSRPRIPSALRLVLLLMAFAAGIGVPAARPAAPQQAGKPSGKGGVAEVSSTGPQRRKGELTIADGDVDIHYGNERLRADHVEYNDQTNEAVAVGHVVFDHENQHLEADEAHYNVATGHGTFRNVRGTIKLERRPNPLVLLSSNPIYFEAREVERFSEELYVIRHAWITICDPEHPTWQFYAQHARLRLNRTVALVNANFRLFRVPLVYFPYATAPGGSKVRQSGFLIPPIGNSTSKGVVIGDAFYWAPTTWMDATMGFELFTRRGNAERGQFRATPWENTSIKYSYFGVNDRGLPAAGVPPEGGQQQQLEVKSLLPKGWRFVADYNELSSLTFRLAFSDTFGDAINSEVRSAIFLTNNFHGFSLNVAALNDKTFLSLPTQGSLTSVAVPATSVSLRSAPEARFGSVEQSPWHNVPVYFTFDAFAGAAHRDDGNVAATPTYTPVDTANFVSRTEFAPRVTVPVHFGPWLNVTATAAFRTSYFGASLDTTGDLTNRSITRNDGEFTLDLRPPTLERIFGRRQSRKKYKHTIEPEIVYRDVTGINHFAQYIRFDADSTLTNTNEVEYGVTQRLFVKDGEDQPNELISWRLVQKHFFDPTFGGALVPGQRNVFETLEEISSFAFADTARNWSPILSDVKINPGGPFDFEEILQYDTQRGSNGQLTTIGTLAKIKPYRDFFFTIADFRLNANPLVLQPKSNQIRTLIGYGSETRKGFNVTTGISYDITNDALQNQLVQVSYNGNCCGLAVEYRRIALGQIRTENQFLASFIIANIGNFGNLRRQEKIF